MSFFGMGSFFRGEDRYDDIDLVLVLRSASTDYSRLVQTLNECFRVIGGAVGDRFDLTILTTSEFALNPLRDMSTLVPIN